MKHILLSLILFGLINLYPASPLIGQKKKDQVSNLYKLSGDLISSNLYLSYISIDMLFHKIEHQEESNNIEVLNSIDQTLKNLKSNLSEFKEIGKFEKKERQQLNEISKICSKMCKNIRSLKKYLKSKDDKTKAKFIEQHEKIWKELSKLFGNS